MAALTALNAASASSSSVSSTALAVLGGLIAAMIMAAGAVGTWAALRVGKNSQVIANYKSGAESWEARANGLKAEKEGLEDQLATAMQTITSLQSKVSTLQELATGHPAVEALSRDMTRSFRSLTEQMTRIENVLKGEANGRPAAHK